MLEKLDRILDRYPSESLRCLPRLRTFWRLDKARFLGVGITPAAGLPVIMVPWVAVDGERMELLGIPREAVAAPALEFMIASRKIGVLFSIRVTNPRGIAGAV